FHKKGEFGVPKNQGTRASDSFLLRLVNLSKGSNKAWVVGFTLLLGAGAVFSASRVELFHDPLSWAPASEDIVVGTALMDEHLGGSSKIFLLFESSDDQALTPKNLIALDNLQKDILSYRDPSTQKQVVTSARSVANVFKEAHQIARGGDLRRARLPKTQERIDALLPLIKDYAPNELLRVANADLSRFLIVLDTHWMPATDYAPLAEHIRRASLDIIGAKGQIEPTGAAFLLLSSLGQMVTDLARSFGFAFLVISLLLIFLFRDIKLGLIATLPNLLPIILTAGLMGLLQIPLSLNNLLLASIALGICVDDTVHFFFHFKRAREFQNNTEEALKHAALQSGRAMLSTSMILFASVAVYGFATLKNYGQFGLLFAATLAFALVADLVFAPALLRFFYGQKRAGNADPDLK
ncbi:MMPL family transporter, partial [Myxococcota bacterium]|nr:MMPL family transporter [Myxococcota bacterium]